MKYGLKNTLYVGIGLLIGVSLALFLIRLKMMQNLKKVEQSIMTTEEIEEVNSAYETAEGEASFTDDVNQVVPLPEEDLAGFIGRDFSLIQSRFKTSEQILSAEYQYFKEECLAVSYDEQSREVLCIENDGKGINPIVMCGLSFGTSYDMAQEILNSGGMFKIDVAEENITAYGELNGIPIKADVVFDNDKIVKITCRKSKM